MGMMIRRHNLTELTEEVKKTPEKKAEPVVEKVEEVETIKAPEKTVRKTTRKKVAK